MLFILKQEASYFSPHLDSSRPERTVGHPFLSTTFNASFPSHPASSHYSAIYFLHESSYYDMSNFPCCLFKSRYLIKYHFLWAVKVTILKRNHSNLHPWPLRRLSQLAVQYSIVFSLSSFTSHIPQRDTWHLRERYYLPNDCICHWFWRPLLLLDKALSVDLH